MSTMSVLARTRGTRARYGEVRVGIITSQEEVIARVRNYVAEHSTKRDLSAESWREVWTNKFGSPEAQANLGGIASFLDDADACAALAGGCDGTASKFFDAFNQKLGKSGDNGWATLPEMLAFLDVKDEISFLVTPGALTKESAPILLADRRTPRPQVLVAPPSRAPGISATPEKAPTTGGGATVVLIGAAALGLLALAAR